MVIFYAFEALKTRHCQKFKYEVSKMTKYLKNEISNFQSIWREYMAEDSWTFVTTYFRNHGISYFEMILKALDEKPMAHGALLKVSKKKFDQIELAKNRSAGFPETVDTAVYLVPSGFQNDSTSHTAVYNPWYRRKSNRLNESIMKEYPEKSKNVIDRFNEVLKKPESDNAKPTDYIELAKQNGWKKEQMHDLWQIIHELPLAQQITWFTRYSHYKGRVAVGPWEKIRESEKKIKIVEIGEPGVSVEDLTSWVKALNDWVDDLSMDKKFGVNLFGTTTQNQLAWRYLKPRKIKLKHTVFLDIKTKSFQQDPRRFRTFQFQSIAQDLIKPKQPLKPEKNWYSEERKRAQTKLESYKEWNDLFSIVVFGKRGTGKSRMIRDVFLNAGGKIKTKNDGIVEVNCAAIPETLAESILFGHKKGAFTDAKQDELGAFGKLKKYKKENDKHGVLFLDEFHHLSKNIQSKLLVALQADPDGMYTYTPGGSPDHEKVKFQLILGTNRTEQELKKKESSVFPDFLDRVLQRKVHMPDLNQDEVVDAWRTVWKQMNFTPPVDDPLQGDFEKKFSKWLLKLNFPGNFRDVERLSILTADIVRENQSEAIDPETFDQLKGEVSKDGAWAKGEDKPQKESCGYEALIMEFNRVLYTDPQSALKQIKKRIAEKLMNQYKSKTCAVDEMKKSPGKNLSLSTLNRWLQGAD